MKFFGQDLKFNGFDIWHKGNFTPPTSLPANGGTADAINFVDTRSVNDKPSGLVPKKLTGMFKYRSSVGNPPVGANSTYVYILNILGWSATEGTGGWPIQIAIGAEGLAYRQAINADTWGPWSKIANTSDIPTKLSQLENDIGAGGGVKITTSVTAPSNPSPGDFWYKEV